MTYRARLVLDDCIAALEMLEKEENLQKWRVHWAAAVALIRAVGHVLDKADGTNPDIKKVARERYKVWNGTSKKHLIFREFIEKERNTLLKEYLSGVHPLDEVSVVVMMTAVPLDGGEPIKTNELFDLDENVYRPFVDGPWAGDDARDVLKEAISWWRKELKLIDKSVQNLQK